MGRSTPDRIAAGIRSRYGADRQGCSIVAKRKGISASKRFEIFKRDGFSCQYCGSTPPGVLLQVDHIVAVAEGGGNDDDNLTTACAGCNSGKGARSLKSVPQALKDRAEEISEREKQLRGYHNILEGRRQRIEDETWDVVAALSGKPMNTFDRRDLMSIRKFLEKLPFHDVLDSAESALARFPYYSRTTFRYFCGICWRKIKGEPHG